MTHKKNTKLVVPAPSPKQKLFMLARKRNIGYGGAKGGGKSWSVRIKSILLAARYPGIKVLIVRETYQELMKNHINEMIAMLGGMAKFREKEMTFKFVNGSRIDFGYCSCDRDLRRYQGVEYDVIFFDEAGNLTEHQMKTIAANVRGANEYPKRVYYTFNPGGKGHTYLKRIFIDRQYLEGEDPEEYEFIQAKVQDNKVLMKKDPGYLKQLQALPPKQRAALLEGRWDVYAGQFFDDFVNDPKHYKDRRLTHVIEPFDIPSGWEVYRSYDFGYSKPFSCGWYAIDYDGCMYRILGLYGCTGEADVGVRWTPEQQFKEMSAIERTHPYLKGRHIHGIADPSIWDQSRGESIAETAIKYGIYFDPGDNNRVAGWMQCHYRFQFDENGYPMFYVFNTEENFIRTIPGLIHSETNPEDLDTKQEDHIADEFRYMCMSRPISPVMPEIKIAHTFDPLNQFQEGR